MKMNNAQAILLIVAIIAVVFGIRFAVRFAANKADDAIHNAIRKKNNEVNPSQPENLADRFKK